MLSNIIKKIRDSANDLRESFCFPNIRENIAKMAEEISNAFQYFKDDLKSEVVPEITKDVIESVGKVNPNAEVINIKNKAQMVKITNDNGGNVYSFKKDNGSLEAQWRDAPAGLNTAYQDGLSEDSPVGSSGLPLRYTNNKLSGRLLINKQSKLSTNGTGFGYIFNVNYRNQMFFSATAEQSDGTKNGILDWRQIADNYHFLHGTGQKMNGDPANINEEKDALKMMNSCPIGRTEFYVSGSDLVNFPKTAGAYYGFLRRYGNRVKIECDDGFGNRWSRQSTGTFPNLTFLNDWQCSHSWNSFGKNFVVTGDNPMSKPYKLAKPKNFTHLKIRTKVDGEFTFYNVPTSSSNTIFMTFSRSGGIGDTSAKHGSYEIFCYPNSTQIYICYVGGNFQLEVAEIFYAIE